MVNLKNDTGNLSRLPSIFQMYNSTLCMDDALKIKQQMGFEWLKWPIQTTNSL